MDYKEFIKAGNEVIYDPTKNSLLTDHELFLLSWEVSAKVVTIGEYPVYYTNGDPDPTPDEYNECCQVEVEGDLEDPQVRLECLLPIIKLDEPTNCIFDTKLCNLIGYDEDEEFAVIEYEDEWHVVDSDDIVIERDFYDLDFSELKKLRGEISIGSIYISDYKNSFGVLPEYLLEECDSYIEAIENELCEDDKEWYDYDTPELFASYFTDGTIK